MYVVTPQTRTRLFVVLLPDARMISPSAMLAMGSHDPEEKLAEYRLRLSGHTVHTLLGRVGDIDSDGVLTLDDTHAISRFREFREELDIELCAHHTYDDVSGHHRRCGLPRGHGGDCYFGYFRPCYPSAM